MALNEMKILLDIAEDDTSKDNALNLYISRATNYVKNYLKSIGYEVEEIPIELNNVVTDIAIFKYRQKGVENIASEGKGALSETYIESLPSDIINQLNSYRRIRVL